jgi:hypothetical protein
MKKETLLIEGTYISNIQTLEWECPLTGNNKSAWGEFTFDGTFYTHDVYNEDDQITYTVMAK